MFLMISGDHDAESVLTPFEDWCVSMDLHPEDWRAWPLYQASVGVADHTPAAS
jgi:hypothetical protein